MKNGANRIKYAQRESKAKHRRHYIWQQQWNNEKLCVDVESMLTRSRVADTTRKNHRAAIKKYGNRIVWTAPACYVVVIEDTRP